MNIQGHSFYNYDTIQASALDTDVHIQRSYAHAVSMTYNATSAKGGALLTLASAIERLSLDFYELQQNQKATRNGRQHNYIFTLQPSLVQVCFRSDQYRQLVTVTDIV